MATTWFACKPCTHSDPTQNTVKVDVSRLHGAGKENVRPPQMADKCQDGEKEKSAEAEKRVQEEQLRAKGEAEERRKREEAEIATKVAAKGAEEERLRQEAAELVRRKVERLRQEVEEERLRQEVEGERLRQEAKEERLRHEAAELKAAAQANIHIVEFQSAQKKLAAWCKTHGYQDVQTPKTTLRGNKKFVLHTAIKREDGEAVKMLLLCGAQKDAKDSKGQTALQVAERIKARMPREMILTALRTDRSN